MVDSAYRPSVPSDAAEKFAVRLVRVSPSRLPLVVGPIFLRVCHQRQGNETKALMVVGGGFSRGLFAREPRPTLIDDLIEQNRPITPLRSSILAVVSKT